MGWVSLIALILNRPQGDIIQDRSIDKVRPLQFSLSSQKMRDLFLSLSGSPCLPAFQTIRSVVTLLGLMQTQLVVTSVTHVLRVRLATLLICLNALESTKRCRVLDHHC